MKGAVLSKCDFCNLETCEERIVYKNHFFFVLAPRHPLSKGHVLIIPKNHKQKYDNLGIIGSIFLYLTTKIVLKKYRKIFKYTGYNLMSNNGIKAGQSVPHFHLHLLLRFDDEQSSPFDKIKDRQSSPITNEELNKLREILADR